MASNSEILVCHAVDEFLQLLIEQVRIWPPLTINRRSNKNEVAPRFPFLDKEALQTLCSRAINSKQLCLLGGRMHLPDTLFNCPRRKQQDLSSRLQMLKQKGSRVLQLGEIQRHVELSSNTHWKLHTSYVSPISAAPTFMNHLLLELRRHFEHHTTSGTSNLKRSVGLYAWSFHPLLEWLDENHKTRRNGDISYLKRNVVRGCTQMTHTTLKSFAWNTTVLSCLLGWSNIANAQESPS